MRLFESFILTLGTPWFFVLTLGSSAAFAVPVNRISSVYKDLSKVEKIYLHAGLISLIEFPDPVLEVRIGNTKAFRVEISQISPRELTVYLLNSSAAPSNMIVRSNQKIYVFDVIPSNSTHQDYVKVSGSYSAPQISSGTIKRVETVTQKALKTKPSKVIKIGGS